MRMPLLDPGRLGLVDARSDLVAEKVMLGEPPSPRPQPPFRLQGSLFAPASPEAKEIEIKPDQPMTARPTAWRWSARVFSTTFGT